MPKTENQFSLRLIKSKSARETSSGEKICQIVSLIRSLDPKDPDETLYSAANFMDITEVLSEVFNKAAKEAKDSGRQVKELQYILKQLDDHLNDAL